MHQRSGEQNTLQLPLRKDRQVAALSEPPHSHVPMPQELLLRSCGRQVHKATTVIGNVGSMFNFCGTYPMRNPGLIFSVPWSSSTAPIMLRSKVDFPDPFGPTIVTISPALIVRSTPMQGRYTTELDRHMLCFNQHQSLTRNLALRQTPSASTTVCSISNPTSFAACSNGSAEGRANASATAAQWRQMRKAGE